VSSDAPDEHVRRARVLRDRDGYVRGYLQYMSFDVPLFFRLLFVKRPDAVVVEPPPTSGTVVRIVCALRRIPYLYYAADVWSDAAVNATKSRLVIRVLRTLELFAWCGARAILSVSEAMTRRLAELGVVGTVLTVGNGVEPTQFSPEGSAVDLDGPYLVYTGTASEVHGAAIFARAFSLVHAQRPDATLVFVGQGSEWPELAEIAATLPEGAIRLVPRVPPADVAAWLRGARAALASVRPGAGYGFAFPTKLYAAALCGTPVVFAGEGPAVDFLAETDAGVAVAYDEAQVAAAMRDALDAHVDPERRRIIRRWAEHTAAGRSAADRAADGVMGVTA
jgi:glycosyltransferase involved in cell wall biosynthesis